MRIYKKLLTLVLFAVSSLIPFFAFAHEAYVLPSGEFHAGLTKYSSNPFAPLIDISHWKTFVFIGICVAVSYLLVLWWSTTKISDAIDKVVRKAAAIGPLVIRLAVGTSFFYSAQSNVIFGPELPLSALPGEHVIRFLLFLTSIMILTGTLIEVASAIGIMLFGLAAIYFGPYMLTYTNYLGELIVLFLFGTHFISVDWTLFKEREWFTNLEKYKFLETPIVRMLYGLALIYAGYTIKFAHQELTVDVYNQYHLVNFFHASASFIAAGAGLSELMIGAFILTGFFLRWTVLISLVFITLSILYFKELLWPHLILYGISFSLIINSRDKLTIDRYLVPWIKDVFRIG